MHHVARVLLPLLVLLLTSAAILSQERTSTRSEARDESRSARQQMVLRADMVGSQYPPLRLKKQAKSESYGFTESNPINVGGGFGSKRHYSYLNSLLGPNGEVVKYTRVGSCCGFVTKRSSIGAGLLEVFEITYEGQEKPQRLYFNWYERRKLLIPHGLTARR